jgi:ribosomal protein L28
MESTKELITATYWHFITTASDVVERTGYTAGNGNYVSKANGLFYTVPVKRRTKTNVVRTTLRHVEEP